MDCIGFLKLNGATFFKFSSFKEGGLSFASEFYAQPLDLLQSY